jgi:molecular chaperone GrpE
MSEGKDNKEEMSKGKPRDEIVAPAQQSVEAADSGTTEDALTALERDRNDLLSRLQRLSADYLNYQKRVQRDIESAREFANEQLIKELLPVLDDMDRALEAGRANHAADDPVLAGMQLMHDKALETLGRYGLKVIEAKGKPFNPDVHLAIMMQPTAEQPPQTVLAEALRGYVLRGRTIRPAGVVVAVALEDSSAKKAGSEK